MDELSIEEVKQKLLTLSAKGAIAKTPTQIKKMNENTARDELEKYELKITQETAGKSKNVILDGVSKSLHYFDVIDEEDKLKFEEELRTNTYLQDEVISLLKTIVPWVPYIGLTLMGFSVAKYAYSRYVRNKVENDNTKERGTDTGVVSDSEQSLRRVKDPSGTVHNDN